MVERVYDCGFAFFGFLRDAATVIAVDVTVDEIRRLIFVEQSVKALEAPVRKIFQIVQPIGGRVRQQDIKAVAFFELPRKAADARVHLLFGVHVLTFAVAV